MDVTRKARSIWEPLKIFIYLLVILAYLATESPQKRSSVAGGSVYGTGFEAMAEINEMEDTFVWEP